MEKEGGKVARRVGEREGWVEDRKWNEEAASLAGKINSGEPNPLALFRSPSLRLSLSLRFLLLRPTPTTVSTFGVELKTHAPTRAANCDQA